jgi:hypothetical protein
MPLPCQSGWVEPCGGALSLWWWMTNQQESCIFPPSFILRVPLSIATWKHSANFQPQPLTDNKFPLYFLVCIVPPHHQWVPLFIATWYHSANFQPKSPTDNNLTIISFSMYSIVGPHHLFLYDWWSQFSAQSVIVLAYSRSCISSPWWHNANFQPVYCLHIILWNMANIVSDHTRSYIKSP